MTQSHIALPQQRLDVFDPHLQQIGRGRFPNFTMKVLVERSPRNCRMVGDIVKMEWRTEIVPDEMEGHQ